MADGSGVVVEKSGRGSELRGCEALRGRVPHAAIILGKVRIASEGERRPRAPPPAVAKAPSTTVIDTRHVRCRAGSGNQRSELHPQTSEHTVGVVVVAAGA